MQPRVLNWAWEYHEETKPESQRSSSESTEKSKHQKAEKREKKLIQPRYMGNMRLDGKSPTGFIIKIMLTSRFWVKNNYILITLLEKIWVQKFNNN